jgi:aminoglycoside phosphotransferase (APT) family kinase protein
MLVGGLMSEDDRIQINASLVRRLIATQFPDWGNLPIRRVETDGWDNSTFRLGDDMKVRLPTAARYVAQVTKEHRWLPRLAALLPVRVPMPLALGEPADDYPWPWTVYRWLHGETASRATIDDQCQFATDLAEFLLALQRIEPDGPHAGPHNFYRGGSLRVYDTDTRQCLALTHDAINSGDALAVWEAALAASWRGPNVWLHGDMAAENLLVENGRLSGVIDFGSCAVGDPACDLTIAWTLFNGEARRVFRTLMRTDEATWARARGWALWKALTLVAKRSNHHQARAVLRAVVKERGRGAS